MQDPLKVKINPQSLSNRFFLLTKHIEENMQILITSFLHDYFHYDSKSVSASFCRRYTRTNSAVEYQRSKCIVLKLNRCCL